MKLIAFILLIFASLLSLIASTTEQSDILFYGGLIGLLIPIIELTRLSFCLLFSAGPHFCPTCGKDWKNSEVTTRNREKWRCPGCGAENKF